MSNDVIDTFCKIRVVVRDADAVGGVQDNKDPGDLLALQRGAGSTAQSP